MDTGPHRDLVGDLAAAIRNNTDIYFGLYYCMFELLNPIYVQEKANGFSTDVYPKVNFSSFLKYSFNLKLSGSYMASDGRDS